MLTAEHALGHCDHCPAIELSGERLDGVPFDAAATAVATLDPLPPLDLEGDACCRPREIGSHRNSTGAEAAAHPFPGPFPPARDDQLTLEGQLRVADDPLAREAVLEVGALHPSLTGIQGVRRCWSCTRLPEQHAAATVKAGPMLSAERSPCCRSSMNSTRLQADAI